MSTSDQIYADYNDYVACYIVLQMSTTPQNVINQLLNGTISFYSTQNEDGSYSITTWNVSGVTQPQLSDLESITPSTVTDYNLTKKIVTINFEYPNIGIIFLDLYSKLAVLNGGSAYTNTTLLAYLKTILH